MGATGRNKAETGKGRRRADGRSGEIEKVRRGGREETKVKRRRGEGATERKVED